jgi:hypothetical protein
MYACGIEIHFVRYICVTRVRTNVCVRRRNSFRQRRMRRSIACSEPLPVHSIGSLSNRLSPKLKGSRFITFPFTLSTFRGILFAQTTVSTFTTAATTTTGSARPSSSDAACSASGIQQQQQRTACCAYAAAIPSSQRQAAQSTAHARGRTCCVLSTSPLRRCCIRTGPTCAARREIYHAECKLGSHDNWLGVTRQSYVGRSNCALGIVQR